MASGLPDYYRGVDIAYYTKAELIVRPKFGGALRAFGQVEVTAGTVKTLTTIYGKGMIYGGSVWLDHTASQANSEVRVHTDFELLTSLSFLRLNEYNIDRARTAVVSLNKYDGTEHIYSVGISYGITFETRIQLIYYEQHDETPTVHYRLVYALV